jgi:hypothetical protein
VAQGENEVSIDDYDYILKFSPATGRRVEPPQMVSMTAGNYRTQYPDTVWKFNPWDGTKRDEDYVRDDPYGLELLPNLHGGVRRGAPPATSQVLSDALDMVDKLRGTVNRYAKTAASAQKDAREARATATSAILALSKEREAVRGLEDRLNNAHEATDAQVHRVIEQQKTINDLRERLQNERTVVDMQRKRIESLSTSPLQSKIAKQSARIRQLEVALAEAVDRDAVAKRLRVECDSLRAQRDVLRTERDVLRANAAPVCWFEESSLFTPEVWNKMLWGADSAKPGADKTVVHHVGRAQSKGGETNPHNRPKYDTASDCVDAILKTRMADVLLKSNELLRDMPWDGPWWPRSPAQIRKGEYPRGLRSADKVDVELRSGTVFEGVTVRDVVWGPMDQGTIEKWRLA